VVWLAGGAGQRVDFDVSGRRFEYDVAGATPSPRRAAAMEGSRPGTEETHLRPPHDAQLTDLQRRHAFAAQGLQWVRALQKSHHSAVSENGCYPLFSGESGDSGRGVSWEFEDRRGNSRGESVQS